MWTRLCVNGYTTNYDINDNGEIRNRTTGKIKDVHINASGYQMVNIYYNHGWKLISVHRLVATTFIENPYNKPEVNHIDGNKLNNSVSNLEWITHKDNVVHAIKHGLKVNPSGFNANHNKYTIDQITHVIELLKQDATNMSKISRITGVPVDTVFLIKTGRRYLDLSTKLNFVPISAASRFNFDKYRDRILDMVIKGYSSKDIRSKLPLPVNAMTYNHYIRKIRKSVNN